MKSINKIREKSHALGIVHNKPRVGYQNVQYLNTTSIAAGFIDHREIDPAKIKHAYEIGDRTIAPASRDRMDRGTLAHMMLLEPHRVAKDVAIWTGDRRAGAQWDDFLANSGNKLVIRDQDYEAVSLAVQAFRFQKQIAELLQDLDAEVAMFSREHSFYVKGMIDAVTKPREGVDGPYRVLIDIKTTEAGFSERSIDNTIREFRNREKMAAYRRWYAREAGEDKQTIRAVNLFLSMEPPYAARIIDIPSMTLDWGERRIVAACDAVQRCLDADSWPMLVAQGEALVGSWEEEELQEGLYE